MRSWFKLTSSTIPCTSSNPGCTAARNHGCGVELYNPTCWLTALTTVSTSKKFTKWIQLITRYRYFNKNLLNHLLSSCQGRGCLYKPFLLSIGLLSVIPQ
ncbi:hypothetical protein QL285_085456 [Trifolium repens]|nr:hypothetical protein QL285_085456 [Trifolium repens]